MKKLFLLLFSIVSILFLPSVIFADNSNVLHLNNYYSSFSTLENIYTNYSSNINYLKNYWQNNLSITYPYYFIQYFGNINTVGDSYIILYATDDNTFSVSNLQDTLDSITPNNVPVEVSAPPNGYYAISYNINTNSYSTSPSNDTPILTIPYFYLNTQGNRILEASDFIYLTSENIDKIVIPSYSSNDYNISSYEIYEGQKYPTFVELYNGDYNPIPDAVYTEVNLSNYDYIVLSLKDYTQQAFNTTIYTQGSLCFTPVYNYGMTQRQDIITDTQIQGCTENYNFSTPVSIYITQSDLDNFAVYYIKKQPNISTTLRIPTSTFDITYITSDNTDPQVSINGRSYPVIPFDDLTDTANKSTDEGYISGQVCSLGDVNCEYRSIGLDISDLWTQPLKVLQSVWTSITSVFAVITEFIMLIPSPLREFLISAFFLSVILGILKMIL